MNLLGILRNGDSVVLVRASSFFRLRRKAADWNREVALTEIDTDCLDWGSYVARFRIVKVVLSDEITSWSKLR